MKLTESERLILKNQHEILAILQPEAAANHLQYARAYELGIESWYYTPDSPVSAKVSREVANILDIYRWLDYYSSELSDLGFSDLNFPGFYDKDGEHFDYCSFLEDHTDRWEKILGNRTDGSGGFHTDNHTLIRYRQMLAEMKKSPQITPTPDILVHVLLAGGYTSTVAQSQPTPSSSS